MLRDYGAPKLAAWGPVVGGYSTAMTENILTERGSTKVVCVES